MGSDTPHTTDPFEALSHRYRRVALYYLREHESASVATLAELVTGWVESGPDPPDPVDHDRVLADLHHRHLPVLAEAGLVDYDREERAVRLAEPSATAAHLIEIAFEADTSGTPPDVGRLLAAADEHDGDRARGSRGESGDEGPDPEESDGEGPPGDRGDDGDG